MTIQKIKNSKLYYNDAFDDSSENVHYFINSHLSGYMKEIMRIFSSPNVMQVIDSEDLQKLEVIEMNFKSIENFDSNSPYLEIKELIPYKIVSFDDKERKLILQIINMFKYLNEEDQNDIIQNVLSYSDISDEKLEFWFHDDQKKYIEEFIGNILNQLENSDGSIPVHLNEDEIRFLNEIFTLKDSPISTIRTILEKANE